MAYREVTMLEVKEVLRLWLAGVPKKRIAVQLGLNVKTVRRYVGAALGERAGPGGGTGGAGRRACSPPSSAGPAGHSAALMATAGPSARPSAPSSSATCSSGSGSRRCASCSGARASRVSYATLRRFAIAELGFGAHRADDSGRRLRARRRGPARHGLDDAPGARMPPAGVGASGRGSSPRSSRATGSSTRSSARRPRRRSRPARRPGRSSTGVFRVLIPDNTKAIVQRADPLEPRLNPDLPRVRAGARLRHRPHPRAPRPGQGPRGTGRAQRPRRLLRRRGAASTSTHARAHAQHWCREDYGRGATAAPSARRGSTSRPSSSRRCAPRRRRRTTSRSGATRRSRATSTPRSRGRSTRCPTQYVGHTLRARADRTTVRFYVGAVCVKVHPADAPRRACLRSHRLPRGEDRLRPAGRREPGAPGRAARPGRRSVRPRPPGRRAARGRGCARSMPSSAWSVAMATPASTPRVRPRSRPRCSASVAWRGCSNSRRRPRRPAGARPPARAAICGPRPTTPSRSPPPSGAGRRRPRMTPDPISADLKTVLRRLKLSRLLDTLPERLTLARQQKLPPRTSCSSSSPTR